MSRNYYLQRTSDFFLFENLQCCQINRNQSVLNVTQFGKTNTVRREKKKHQIKIKTFYINNNRLNRNLIIYNMIIY